ncbi:MAG TPA: nuclear transport factor 2 family protein [Micromonosporaceae bacterium]
MAAGELKALLERHVLLFNEAVRTNNYGPFLQTFDETAVMRYADFPIGPYHGLSEITEAYETQPPSDTMALIDMQEVGADAVKASFEWDAGGTGQMFLRWQAGRLVELVITLAM